MDLETPKAALLTRRASRRTVLRGGSVAAGGIALFLVGCTGDDDDDATAEPTNEATAEPTSEATAEPTEAATEEPTAAPAEEATAEPTAEPTEEPSGGAPSKVVVQSVTLTGDDGTVVLRNLSDAAVVMDGWFICQRPAYWAIPSVTLEPGAEITLHAGAGTDDADDLFAGGGFGSLSGSRGEIGLYDSASFGSSDAIVSFVAWNGSGGRASEAVGAGIWGSETVEATDGDTILFVGPSEDASGYSLQ